MLVSSKSIQDNMVVALMSYHLQDNTTDVDDCGFGLVSLSDSDKIKIKSFLEECNNKVNEEQRKIVGLTNFIHLLKHDDILDEVDRENSLFKDVKLDTISYLESFPELEGLNYHSCSGYLVLSPNYFHFECERIIDGLNYASVIFRSCRLEYKRFNL